MPRRYGGLCLPMNEALTSGLPVIMSNQSPFFPATGCRGEFKGGFVARMPIQYFNVNVALLGPEARRVGQHDG